MDSLKKVVEIMQYVEDNDEKVTENQLKKKFGNDYRLFSRYCLGGNQPYAMDYGAKKEGEGVHKLTQTGVRKLYELRKTLAEENQAKWMKWATVTIAGFTVLQFIRLLL